MRKLHRDAKPGLPFLLVISLGVIIGHLGCSVSPVSSSFTKYADFRILANKDTSIQYFLPRITPTETTKQTQTKGGITITVEVIPTTVNFAETSNRRCTFSDKPGYDVYEIKKTPKYEIWPNTVQFKIKIRNNETVPLRLNEIGFAIIVDGVQFSFPEEQTNEWNKGLVLSGFEKEYIINGPIQSSLNNAQAVYLFMNGVPTSYDKAGHIVKKDNFEWYFKCENQPFSKAEKITYSYEEEPVRKEKCVSCSGEGGFSKTVTCPTCNGKGAYLGSDGKAYTCYDCRGNKVVTRNNNCSACYGKGQLSFPKSNKPPVASKETWNGWRVNVITKPAGAKIFVFSSTGEYKQIGLTKVAGQTINWLSPPSKEYPIRLEFNGKMIDVMPYSPAGKPLPSIIVEFSASDPIIKKGKLVTNAD